MVSKTSNISLCEPQVNSSTCDNSLLHLVFMTATSPSVSSLEQAPPVPKPSHPFCAQDLSDILWEATRLVQEDDFVFINDVDSVFTMPAPLQDGRLGAPRQ